MYSLGESCIDTLRYRYVGDYDTATESLSLEGTIVRINNKQYLVKPALKQDDDDPAFTSWPLVPLRGNGRKASDSILPEFVIKTVQGDLEGQVIRAQAEVSRLYRIPTVPVYHLGEPDSQQFGRLPPLAVIGENGEKIEAIVVRDFVRGILLSEWIEMYERAQDSPREVFAGLRDTNTWFELARKLIEALILIHNERLVHGDLRPRSIMLKGILLDFLSGKKTEKESRAQLLNPDFSKLEVIYLDPEGDVPEKYAAAGIIDTGTFRRKYDSPLRLFEKKDENSDFIVAKRKPAHWFALTDIFSLGMILFELGYGSDAKFGPFIGTNELDHPLRSKEGKGPTWFKVNQYQARLSNQQLKDQLFDAWKIRLKGLNSWRQETAMDRQRFICMREVILACLRTSDPAATGLSGILGTSVAFDPRSLDRFFSAKRTESAEGAGTEEERKKHAGAIQESVDGYLDSCAGKMPETLKRIIRQRSVRLIGRLGKLTDPNYGFDRIGGRETIVETMVLLLNGLQEHECFQAILTPSFFRMENIGLYGRVRSALQLAALRGRNVEWVIVVNEEELYTKEIAEVLDAHHSSWRHIRRFLAEKGHPYGIYYKIATTGEYDRLLRNQYTSLAIGTDSTGYESLLKGEGLLIAPDYHGEVPTISALRLWPALGEEGELRHKVRRQQLHQAFHEYSEGKQHIRTFYR